MRVRRATRGDRAASRDVAERSFRASYALSPSQTATSVEESFSDDALRTRLDDPSVVVLVAERDDDVVGFADVERNGDVRIRWLHVHPDAPGEGAGTALIDRVDDTADEETESAGLAGQDVGDGSLVWRICRAATWATSTTGCRPRVRPATRRGRRSPWWGWGDYEPAKWVPVSGGVRSHRRLTDDDSSAVHTGR